MCVCACVCVCVHAYVCVYVYHPMFSHHWYHWLHTPCGKADCPVALRWGRHGLSLSFDGGRFEIADLAAGGRLPTTRRLVQSAVFWDREKDGNWRLFGSDHHKSSPKMESFLLTDHHRSSHIYYCYLLLSIVWIRSLPTLYPQCVFPQLFLIVSAPPRSWKVPWHSFVGRLMHGWFRTSQES